MQQHRSPRELRRGLFTTAKGVAVVRTGALAGPGYRRLLRRVYQCADLPVTYGTMIAAASAVAGPGSARVGPSAAWAHGCGLAGPDDPVHVTTGGWNGAHDWLVRHRMTLRPGDVVETASGMATSPARTAVDLARGIGTAELTFARRVAWIDALLRAGALTQAEAVSAVGDVSGLRGLALGRRVVLAARAGVDLPKETELRLLVVGLGFPEPLVQCPVVDGDVTFHLDMGWETYRAGLEYDGAAHLERRQHSRDLERHNRLRRVGWTVLQVDAWALAHPGRVMHQLAQFVPRNPQATPSTRRRQG